MGEPVSYNTSDDIAVITINNPPVNAFGPAVAEQLARAVARLQAEVSVKAAVVIGAGSTFVAGADIKEFARMQAGEIPFENVLNPVFKQIEGSAKPMVMAIHGAALGGGLELAMAGHYRVAAPGAQIGQPEVKLGLISGAGGTQRLPRLAGLAKAAEMCAGGNPIKAEEATHAGIVDQLIEGDLLAGALAFAREIARKGIPRTRARDEELRPEDSAAIFAAARERARKEQRGQQAPLAAIDAIEAATKMPFEEGMAFEAKIFRERLFSKQSKALVYVFLGEREIAKIPGVSKQPAILTIQKAAVIGTDAVSDGIAKALTKAGIATSAEDGLAGADLIVVSDKDAGKIREIDEGRKADSILALAGEGGAEKTGAAGSKSESLAAIHFPPTGGRLMEVMTGDSTSAATIASLFQLAKKLRKAAVLESKTRAAGMRLMKRMREERQGLIGEGLSAESVDGALHEFGFETGSLGGEISMTLAGAAENTAQVTIIERCVYAMANEGARMLGEGAVPRAVDIDMICVLGYGFPAYRGGPMWMADAAGLGKVLGAVREFYARFGERWMPAPLLEQLVADGKTLASVKPS